jgi:hypothetical protein
MMPVSGQLLMRPATTFYNVRPRTIAFKNGKWHRFCRIAPNAEGLGRRSMRRQVIAQIAAGAVGAVLLVAPATAAFCAGPLARLPYGGIAWIASVLY